jgi:ABC-type transporter Mla subunit MlaD
MAGRSRRDNILAGLFIVLGLALAVFISFMLSEHKGIGPTRALVVRFPLELGAPGIKAGSVVNLGGQKIGRVTSVAPHPLAGPSTAVDVHISIPAAMTLYPDAVVSLDRPLLGTLSSINISSVGTTGDAGAAIPQGGVIAGNLAPPAFLAQAGIGPKQIEEVRDIISNLDATTHRLSSLVETVSPQAEEGIADARQLLGDLRTRFDTWSQSVDSIIASAQSATAGLTPLVDDSRQIVTDARAAIADMRAILTDNRARIDAFIASVESAARKLDTQTLDQINTALADGRAAIDMLRGALDRLSTIADEQTPNVRRIMANLRLMSDNLKLTAVEVRSQPWRALYRPTNKELSTQALYDATRAFAVAASDVRAASETIESLAAGAATRTDDGRSIDEAGLALAEAMQRYHQAEQALLDVLIREQSR